MGGLRLSDKEVQRQAVLIQVEPEELKMKEAADAVGISVRQLRRSRRRYEKGGLSYLAHKSRGKPSGRALSKEDNIKIRKLLHERYSDFGPTFAAEKLTIDLGRMISNEKIRQIQIEEGLHRPKRRRQGRYHPRRKRRSREGELVQTDASEHDWLENGIPINLIVFIDDATSKIKYAGFVESETTRAYMILSKGYIERYGRPRAFYVDKHGIFRQNNKEAREQGIFTNFGQSLRELDIELICAHSPQAKGRVERGFGTLQDRLIKEMRLAGIKTIDEANRFLPPFISDYNTRFSVPPKESEDAHRPLNKNIDLKMVFTTRETRKLSKNLTFQYEGILYQIDEAELVNRLRNQKVEIRTTSAKEMLVTSSWGKSLKFEAYGPEKPIQRTLDTKDLNQLWPTKCRRPSKYHPWR
ncbi:MAG: ISNCY family transposase [Chlamydiales bacterium]